jgi:hypothetical protein
MDVKNTIRCRSEFFNCFQNKDNIKKINILEGSDYINPEMIKKFKNLETLELPNSIKKVEFDLSLLKNLTKIKCNEEVLKNLPKNSKKYFQEIEIISNNAIINRDILEGCINIQNVRINNSKINYEPPSHKTTIEDIINFDSENKQFEKYVRNILYDLEVENARNYEENNILEQIAGKMTYVCLKIKQHTNGKLSPYPVQCFGIIKLVYKILTGRGALVEIKTGEGKSYIIAVIAIILVQFDRKIDIVTSNLHLAFRDEKEQSEYYKLFGIDSGVICKKNGDEEYIDIYKVDYRQINTNYGFYTHILEYPIIYSTNYNYEFLELYSIFRSEPVRKRKYDVVLIDEVDNMLLDQLKNPSII